MTSLTQNCTMCTKPYFVVDQEQAFYKKKALPLPTSCPECRQKDRLRLRNERNLFRRKCDQCQKDIISTYPPDAPYPIYCQECFWQWMG